VLTLHPILANLNIPILEETSGVSGSTAQTRRVSLLAPQTYHTVTRANAGIFHWDLQFCTGRICRCVCTTRTGLRANSTICFPHHKAILYKTAGLNLYCLSLDTVSSDLPLKSQGVHVERETRGRRSPLRARPSDGCGDIQSVVCYPNKVFQVSHFITNANCATESIVLRYIITEQP
jgi:hypothetical protein